MDEPPLENYPDTPLRAAMLKRSLSIRGLAKVLARSDDARDFDTQRTAVKRWLDPEKGISEMSARRLAPHVGLRPEQLQRQGRTRTRHADRLERVEAQVADNADVIDQLSSELATISQRIDALERKPARQPRAQGDRG